jgi:hypothetical protein
MAKLMRIRSGTICGVVLILIGIAALIWPQFSYRVQQQTTKVAGSDVVLETRRIVHFPLWFSIPILTIGAAFIVIGFYQE